MRAVAVYAALFVPILVLFLLVPQLDLWTSGLFFAADGGFFLSKWPPVELLYRAVPWIACGVVLAIAGAGAWLFLVQRPLWRFDRKALLFLSLSIALGPGLLANVVLKDHWGRARPTQIEAFGGTRRFTPAPLPASQCAHNCSFVSGHAALGFSLVGFAFLLPTARPRRWGIAAALAFGGLIGLVRIVQGGHFLSDVVYAGLLVYGTTALLHWWIVTNDGLAAPLLLRLYRIAGRGAAAIRPPLGRALISPTIRLLIGTAAVAVLVMASIARIDRPLAWFLHARGADFHRLFDLIGRLGLTWGYLAVFAIAFGVLHWGGGLARLRPFASPMRALSGVPAFLFVSLGASGIVADLLKVGFGRARPKLLFNADIYGFSWFGRQADYWSFPSGHTVTIAALMTALWYLWPRHLLFYILAGMIVAGSRVAVGAHYLSDTMAGAWLAVLITRGVAWLFARGGIDLAAALRARLPSSEGAPWPCRRFAGMRAIRSRAGLR